MLIVQCKLGPIGLVIINFGPNHILEFCFLILMGTTQKEAIQIMKFNWNKKESTQKLFDMTCPQKRKILNQNSLVKSNQND